MLSTNETNASSAHPMVTAANDLLRERIAQVISENIDSVGHSTSTNINNNNNPATAANTSSSLLRRSAEGDTITTTTNENGDLVVERTIHLIDDSSSSSSSSPKTTTAITIKTTISKKDDVALMMLEGDDEFKTSFLQPCSFPKSGRYSFVSASREILKIGMEAAMSALLNMASTTMLMMAVGQTLELEQFAAVGVGLSVFNMVFVGPTLGFAASLDTLATAAYGRNPTGTEVGRLTQLGFALGLLLCVPISLFFVFLSPLFVSVVFGDEYVYSSYRFLLWSIPAVFAYAPMLVIQRSLQAELLSRPPMLSTFFSTAATLVGCFTLVPMYKIHGVALTLALCNIVQLVAMLYFAPADALFKKVSWYRVFVLPVVSRGKDVGDFWEVMEPHRVKAYCKVAATTTIAVSMGFITWELMVTIAARIGEKEVAMFNIFMNVVNLTWCFSQGFGTAASTYAGKFLGMGYGNLALAYSRTCTILSQLSQWLCALLIIIFHRSLFGLYTDESEVLQMLHNNLFGILLVVLFCDLQYVGFSIFRGCGKQHEAPWIAGIGWICFGLPLGIGLGLYTPYGASGLLVGLVAESMSLFPMQLFRIMSWSWPDMARLACKKQEEDGESAATTSTKATVTDPLLVSNDPATASSSHSSTAESALSAASTSANALSQDGFKETQEEKDTRQNHEFYDEVASGITRNMSAPGLNVNAPGVANPSFLTIATPMMPTLTANELETELQQMPLSLQQHHHHHHHHASENLYKASVEVSITNNNNNNNQIEKNDDEEGHDVNSINDSSSLCATPLVQTDRCDSLHLNNSYGSQNMMNLRNETFSLYLEKTPNLAPSAIATAILSELEDVEFVLPPIVPSSPSNKNNNNNIYYSSRQSSVTTFQNTTVAPEEASTPLSSTTTTTTTDIRQRNVGGLFASTLPPPTSNSTSTPHHHHHHHRHNRREEASQESANDHHNATIATTTTTTINSNDNNRSSMINVYFVPDGDNETNNSPQKATPPRQEQQLHHRNHDESNAPPPFPLHPHQDGSNDDKKKEN